MPPIQQAPSIHHTSRTVLVVLLLIMLSAGLVLVILKNIGSINTASNAGTYETGYADGFRAAREIATGALPAANQPTNGYATLSGTVTAAQGNNIEFWASGLILDEAIDGVGMERMVTIQDDTEIILMQQVSNDTLTAAQRSFILTGENPIAGQDPASPPAPFRASEGTVADIAVGDTITVEGADGQDLALVAEITAGKITVIKTTTVENEN
ncbi:MAG: hypothetical protein RL141_602 [Candidatus Parcubacteria bacterium]|jgi:hypothetical protein